MPEDATIPPAASTGGERGGAALQGFSAEHIRRFEQAVRRRIPISEKDRETMVNACRAVIEACEDKPGRTRRALMRAVSLMALLDAQSMRDEHHIEDKIHDQAMQRERFAHEDGILDLRMRRAEEGKPNDCVAVQVTPVRELPLPDAMRSMRKRLLEPSES